MHLWLTLLLSSESREVRTRAIPILISGVAWASAACVQAENFPNEIAERSSTEKLQPIAPWNIEFGDDRCILSRMFEGESGRHLLYLDQTAPGEIFTLAMAGRQMRRFPRGTFTSFGMRNDVPMDSLGLRQDGTIPDVGPAIILRHISLENRTDETEASTPAAAGIALSSAAKVDRVVIKLGSTAVSFETGNLEAPIQALNTCAMDLLASWGLDPEQHRSYTPPVWIDPETTMKSVRDRYPRSALYQNGFGAFQTLLTIEADGSVSECLVNNTEQPDVDGEAACEELRKASFEPALDTSGQPMRSFYSGLLTFSTY